MGKNTFTLGKRRTYGYASGIITESLIYNMYFTYYLVFLTDVAKLNPALAGTVSLISIICDAVADPIIGYLSDRPGSDKRRFMARALFPMVLMILAAFIQIPGASDGLRFLYYVVVTILFWISYTTYTIPYYAVVAEITENYDERTNIRSISSMINTAAILLGNILPAVLPAMFVGLGLSLAMGWVSTIGVLAVLALVFGILAVRSLKVAKLRREPSNETAKFDFFRTMGSIFRLKPFIPFAIFVLFYLIASSMIQANIVYLILNCVGLTTDYMAVVVLVLAVIMMIFIPITTKIAEKKDRRTACLVIFSLMLLGLITAFFLGVRSLPMLIFEAATMALGSAAFWTVFYSISYDLVEVDEMVNDVRREGAITAVPQFIQKFGAAIGMWLAGIFLAFYGYNANSPVQTEATKSGIENIGTIIPAVFLSVSIIGLILYPITKKRYSLLVAALEKKRAGEPYDVEGLSPLIGKAQSPSKNQNKV